MKKTETAAYDSGKYKWVMLALLTVTYFLMHATRQVFNAVLPQVKAGMPGVTDTELGMSRTVFLFAYALMVPFVGIATDFFRRKWVIVLGTAMFAVSVFFTGYAESMLMLFVMYGVLNGVGQCMIPSAASSLVAQYHVTTRSTALSIYQSALYVGVVLSSLSAGTLSGLSADGWRWPFWIFGGISLVWAAVLFFFLRDTPALETEPGENKPKLKDACLAMVSKPSAWLITFAFGMLVFGSNCFRTWMPAYIQQQAHWNLSTGWAAFHSVAWFFGGSFIGIAIGARMSDTLVSRRRGIRLELMAIGLAVSAPAMAAMVYMPNVWLCGLAMLVFGVASGFFDCNLYAGLFEVVAPRYRAAAMGVYLCGAFLIGCPATAVLGWVGQNFSLQHGIAIFGATYALGAVAMFVARVKFFRRDCID
jgi:MFS family permease